MFCNEKTTWSLFTVLLVSALLVTMSTDVGRADFVFGQPSNLGPPVNSSEDEYGGPGISPDGLELYFVRGRSASATGDLWVARRATPDGEWGSPANLGLVVNAPSDDWGPSISADGLSLYFNSNRAGGSGGYDVWMTTRTSANDAWVTPINLGATVNSGATDWQPCISSDGLELYFTSNRPGGYGGLDLWVTARASVQDDWGTPVNLGPTINTAALDVWAGISPDGLVLFFASTKPGGFSTLDIYMARRATRKDPWGSPVNLGPGINHVTWQSGSKVSSDGSMLYFMSGRPGLGGIDLWQAPIIPVVDFNGDGKVDAKDIALLEVNWGKNTTLCDIGPFAWGDGVVDERDLRVLMESLVTPGPKASDVLSNVILSWISPSFAETCDVYLGTSREVVSSASRANPQGVLLRQGQTASTYDPPGVLEFSRTYYWRVDFVISGATPLVYQGPVLQFTTAAQVYPIKNITATASTLQPGSGPEKTVDGSGLDKSDGHSTDAKDMWWSTGVGPNSIQYEFDRVYNLHELWVWNFNQVIEPFMGFGAKTVKIEYSTDGTAWTPLANVPEFKRASGKAGYMADTKISFGGVAAKFVKLTIEKNWSATAPQTGLSEVRLFATQSPAAAQP